MNARFLSRWIVVGVLSASILLILTMRSGVAVDSNTNGFSDIWELLYPGATNATADLNGDGVNNLKESIWGSNPFQLDTQFPARTAVQLNPQTGMLDISWRSFPGKRYQLQSRTNLTLGSWTNDGGFVDGVVNVSILTNSRPSSPLIKMYRVQAADKDADGDGVNDWEELLIGLNPNSTNSNVDGIRDGAYVTNQLALPNTVTIQATQPFASKDGPQPGMLTITREQKLFPITVNLARTGTAVAGLDYAGLPASVTLGSGVTTTNIIVNPVPNTNLTGNRSVSVALAPGGNGSGFTLASFSNATVIISESTVPTGTGLLGRYYDTASTTFADAANLGQSGTYIYTRLVPNTNGTITVPFTNATALAPGNLVKLTFTSGNLNNALYNHSNYVVTAVTNGLNFTVGITATNALPNTGNGNCNFSIQSFPHPAVITRVDPTVDFNWLSGTPNGTVILPNNSPDNYSSAWDAYLNPTNPGNYVFYLDADDRARVLLDTGSGLTQILEFNWDGPATNGVLKKSGTNVFAVPATPAQRYRIRVEHVETTSDATCRLLWSVNGGASNNIPQAQVFSHSQAMTYSYTTNASSTNSGAVVITPTGGHSFVGGETVSLDFSTGNLFTNTSYAGLYAITNVIGTNTFTVGITNVAGVPRTGTGSGFLSNSASATTGWMNHIYANTNFSGSPGRVGVDSAITVQSNGVWGSGTPDVTLIQPDTFSIRWTGQVQPQFSELYTLVVAADDGCALWINGQPQQLRMLPSAVTGGSTYVYDGTTGNTVINYASSILVSNSFVVGDIVRLDPTSGGLFHNPSTSPTYTYDGSTGIAVVNYSNLTNVAPGSLVNGETIELDPTSGPLNTLASIAYVITNVTSTNFTVDFGTGVFASGAGNITIADTRNATITAATSTNFTVNFGAGKYTNGSAGNMAIDMVGRPLKDWASNGNDRYAQIEMLSGVRYDIQLDYYENTNFAKCQLYWYSPSQPKQIIPANRLYPSSGALAPASFTGETDATALVGGLFSYTVTGNNGASVSVSGQPAWLTFVGGVLSGTPPPGSAGDYQVVITTTSSAGTSTSVLNLHVGNPGGTINREYWSGVTGTNVNNIPIANAPTGTNILTSLQATNDFGDNYGARIRGYITAPVSGNYYFWIASSNSSELWISNDDEPVNAFKRAWVTAGTGSLDWNHVGEPNQKSPWLALEAGKKYYLEILHKAGVGAGDNLAVGWSKPGESDSAPSEVVPGYVLSSYVAPSLAATPGTLYVATMLAQGGAVSSGVGNSTLRLSADETYAIFTTNYAGLTGPVTSEHIHTDPYLDHPSTIVFDIDVPGIAQTNAGGGKLPDGTYKWVILPVGTLSAADIREIIKQGKAYINLHTAGYPNGEIRGNYTLANGTRTFTPPPAPPSWTSNDNNVATNAVRFLTQATFGANPADIATLTNLPSYEAWIDAQFTNPPTRHLPEVLARELGDVFGPFDVRLSFNAWWKNSISAPDQLRQRVAFALSEIHVVSAQGPLLDNSRAISDFYDHLLDNAFGNFRDILVGTTLRPAMGRYLDMLRNDKPDLSIGRSPNENYAREIKQLFSIGLYRMWPDGTLILSSKDAPIDTYTQREIVGIAHVFTGWDYGYNGPYHTTFSAAADWTRAMREVPARHFTGPKRILNNEVLPGLSEVGGQPLDPYANHISSQFNDPAYQALPAQELNAVHDQLFNHPNVGPFICRQLIQRLVTSDPSRDYLYRVVQKFNNNGSGVRGDMKAVIKGILMDYEARSRDMYETYTSGGTTNVAKSFFGKQREPIMRVAAAARAFRPTAVAGTYSQSNANTITITTAAPHLLQSGNSVFLEFTDTTGDTNKPAPSDATYVVQTVVNSTNYTINAPGWFTGTYLQTGGTTNMTITMNGHWLPAGGKAFFEFTSGPYTNFPGVDNTNQTVLTSTAVDFPGGSGNNSGTTFTIAAPLSSTNRSGNMMIVRFPGTYATSGGMYTIDTGITGTTGYGNEADHHLFAGDSVFLNFITTRDTTSGDPTTTENDLVYPVVSVPDANSFTVTARVAANAAINNDNGVYIFPLKAQPLVRNGTINTRQGTFNMADTQLELDQTPLSSPTVFNFFLPSYKYPGALASQGMTTPEFQLTAETTVLNQANYLYSGVYTNGNTNGISAFSGGSLLGGGPGALVMDLSPWMGLANNTLGLGAGPQPAQVWTSDANLSTLVDRLNSLLVAGQISPSNKTFILGAVTNRLFASIAVGSPCTNTTTAPHGFAANEIVTISGVTNGTFSPTINGTFTVTVVSSNKFSVPVNCTSIAGLNLTGATISTPPYNNASPSATNIRDRLRAIVHLIITSPDYTIQR